MATEFVRNNLSCGFEYYIIKHVQSRDCNGEALKMPGWETIKMDTGEILNGLLENLSNLTYIKAEDIPNIDLYMDQVTTFMDKRLRATTRNPGDDKVLTKTMINNYAKNNLLPSPEKKKYSKEHMLLLIFIYYFKNILSINDIQTLFKPITDEYFHAEGDYSLQDIYTEVFEMEKLVIPGMKEDVTEKFRTAEKTFTDAPEKDRDFLRQFAFICLLSSDVYAKKMLIENMIDNLRKEDSRPKGREDSKAKTKEDSKK